MTFNMNFIYTIVFYIATIISLCFTQNIGDDCQVARSGARGVCRIINNCQEVIEDIRKDNLFPTQCGFRGRDQIVCCPIPVSVTTTTTPAPIRISMKSMENYFNRIYNFSNIKFSIKREIRMKIILKIIFNLLKLIGNWLS